MLVAVLGVALAVSRGAAGAWFRAHVLRPCRTVIVDYAEAPAEGAVAARRMAAVFTLAVLVVLAAFLLALVALLGMHPLLAVEIVSAVGLLAAHVVGRVLRTSG